jgi:HSP20 family protein
MTIEPTTQQSELQTREKAAVQREGTRPGLVFRPDVDIVERPEEFVVTADLPGADQQHVDVKLEDGVLAIDARLAVEPDASWTPRYAEYRLGSYHREFALSDGIDADGIEATMRDGVLELRLPKADRHRPRRVDVRAG